MNNLPSDSIPKPMWKASWWSNFHRMIEVNYIIGFDHEWKVIGLELSAKTDKYEASVDTRYGLIRCHKRTPLGLAFCPNGGQRLDVDTTRRILDYYINHKDAPKLERG